MNPDSLRTLGVPPNAWKVDAKIADITRSQLEPKIVTLETETKTLCVDLAKAAMLVRGHGNAVSLPQNNIVGNASNYERYISHC